MFPRFNLNLSFRYLKRAHNNKSLIRYFMEKPVSQANQYILSSNFWKFNILILNNIITINISKY